MFQKRPKFKGLLIRFPNYMMIIFNFDISHSFFQKQYLSIFSE